MLHHFGKRGSDVIRCDLPFLEKEEAMLSDVIYPFFKMMQHLDSLPQPSLASISFDIASTRQHAPAPDSTRQHAVIIFSDFLPYDDPGVKVCCLFGLTELAPLKLHPSSFCGREPNTKMTSSKT